MMKIDLISEDHSKILLEYLKTKPMEAEYVVGKNQLNFSLEGTEVMRFRLPISIASPEAYYSDPEDRANYVLIMIRSGIASVGYFEDGENLHHKVFRAYMVRKKQGVSQIKFLKTKGKSRAGSRVRLAETKDFFEDINKKLKRYFDEWRIDRIGLSCPTTLIPYFYGSKTPTPFDRKDPRLMKIPRHVQNPTYEALLEVNRYLLKGELRYTQKGSDLKKLFSEITRDKKNQSDEEDW